MSNLTSYWSNSCFLKALELDLPLLSSFLRKSLIGGRVRLIITGAGMRDSCQAVWLNVDACFLLLFFHSEFATFRVSRVLACLYLARLSLCALLRLVARKHTYLSGVTHPVPSHAAPISKDVLRFMRGVFGCHVLEGYGQTETTSGVTVTFPCKL
jgi:acyl-CoA synthetase (AMP-forming)/AMP-acid ligase II